MPDDSFDPPIDAWSRALRAWARSSLPGRNSAFRKFRRRNLGRRFDVTTTRGFRLGGIIGDSVENAVAVRGEFEPGLTKFLTAQFRESASFVDLGCNIGYFSCLFRHLQPRGRLLSIDANPRMAGACRENLAANSNRAEATGVATVLHQAIGAEAGVAQLQMPKARASRGTLGDLQLDPTAIETFAVPMDTLAATFAANAMGEIEVMKIDVEGFEATVLRSAPSAVAEKLKCIVFEFSESNLQQCGATRDDFGRIEWLKLFSVASLDERDGTLHPLSAVTDHAGSEGTIVLRRR